MHIKKLVLLLFIWIVTINKNVIAQTAPPSSGAAMASSRSEATPVNYFTGIPSISLPIYSYNHRNGIGINISLDYFAGGIKVNEESANAGLGWNLNSTGMITRTVRGGIPDDCPITGFSYLPTIPLDTRSKFSDYLNECEDPEQDVFQFNFSGRSGKFYIGKDSSVFSTPLSKMRIQFTRTPVIFNDSTVVHNPKWPTVPDTIVATIKNFVITTEDGVKYYFNDAETQYGYFNTCYQTTTNTTKLLRYATAWYLSKIKSATGTDSITFNYKNAGTSTSVDWNQSVSIANGVVKHSDTLNYSTNKINIKTYVKKLYEIILPDSKKVQFSYSNKTRIKIMDSVFRYGYILNPDTVRYGFLASVSYYNDTIIKQAYSFGYTAPYTGTAGIVCTVVTPAVGCTPAVINCLTDSVYNLLNKKDHWGYYNGANNTRDYVPTVPGFYTGANREPNALAVANTIRSIKDPTGSTTFYDFENNDVYPYTTDKQGINIDAATTTQNTIVLSRVLGTTTYFKITLNVANSPALPITGAGNMVVTITNATSTIIYSTHIVNLLQLYYNGYASFASTAPVGSCLIKTTLQAGTTCSAALGSQISWYNQTASLASNGTLTGGIRIKQISHYDPFTSVTDTLSTYKYVTASGKSSGFLAVKPVYNYYDGTTHIIRSRILHDLDYSQGSGIGYSRVEIIKGSAARNIGKQVYEYTSTDDQDYDNSPIEIPFVPRKTKDWAWGLAKRVLVYDNTGRLIQVTKNNFTYVSKAPIPDSNYRSYKQPQVSLTGNLSNNAGCFYFPEAGRADIIATADTFYHPDNSITTSRKDVVYDTNYNVTKIITPYDYNKSLTVEKRLYYPYNYTLGGVVGAMRDSGIYAPIATETWITGDAYPRMLSATVSDFTKPLQAPFKPFINYALQTNKPILLANIGLFNPALLVRNATYMVPQQSILYDRYGNVLETANVLTGIKSTAVYGYNNTRAIATISNAGYADVAYTSFEKNALGTWAITGTQYDSTNAITGKCAYELSTGYIYKAGLNSALTYIVTYWTKGTVYNISTTLPVLLDERNGWKLYNQKISGLTTISVYGTGLIDELRLYPMDANMATTCYENTGEVHSACDANNNIVYNEYDLMRRPLVIRDKDKNIVKKYQYSEGYSAFNFTPNWQVGKDCFGTPIALICERDTNNNYNGKMDRIEIDMNPNSETYNTERYLFDHIDSLACPPPVPDCGTNPAIKYINGTCQTGCKIITSSIRIRQTVNLTITYVWNCTYHYQWIDNSISPDYVETKATACTIGPEGGSACLNIFN
jgi:hypothetical protein